MPNSLDIQLKNQSNSDKVYAFICGRALQHGGRLVLLKPVDALVEPCPFDPTDPNHNINWAFAELTLDNSQLFANISYVDMVPRLPIALTLKERNGKVQHALKAQAQADKRPWNKLIVNKDSKPLRALNPTHSKAVGASFDGYYEPYVNNVWEKYHAGPCHTGSQNKLCINTQNSHGVLTGSVDGKGQLVIGGEAFKKPNTYDIFSCNTGPFITDASAKRNAIIPRLATKFIRSSILDSANHPSNPDGWYKKDPTNHYSRIVHNPDGGKDHSGKVNAGDPAIFIVTVGGKNAYAGDKMP
ncbi:glycoside hydrolase family 64 protein [Podospora fimiseda]|uniref:Glycoside hydrolase family 64 protein n=1 Tax=Podospora fimiseda TaxID=252190 RepID=A0AAN7BFE4_9PEZI|nr:glycoside hydrolase family 64 protein [Podospora fimiseda]